MQIQDPACQVQRQVGPLFLELRFRLSNSLGHAQNAQKRTAEEFPQMGPVRQGQCVNIGGLLAPWRRPAVARGADSVEPHHFFATSAEESSGAPRVTNYNTAPCPKSRFLAPQALLLLPVPIPLSKPKASGCWWIAASLRLQGAQAAQLGAARRRPGDNRLGPVDARAYRSHRLYPETGAERVPWPDLSNAATRELCALLLPDSAHLQEEDARYAAKKNYSSHKPPLPLYTVAESQTALAQFREIPRADTFQISPQFSLWPHDAGHILGSSWLELTITENGKRTLVVFSGDVGRYDQPILKDPESPSRADILLCESTYGDREHPAGSVADELADVINRTAKRGGAVVIPAFAVGRTQTIMYYLRELQEQQRIPVLPTYVDSPMAIGVTGLYASHHEDHDEEFSREESAGKRDPLNVREVHMTRSVEDSKKINDVVSPCIIISASGMITGGRILHHLARRLPDSRCSVLIVGYQAEGSGGRALQDHAQILRIHGQEVPVKAEIVEITQLSAHAGRSELSVAFWISNAASANILDSRRAERAQWIARCDCGAIPLARRDYSRDTCNPSI